MVAWEVICMLDRDILIQLKYPYSTLLEFSLHSNIVVGLFLEHKQTNGLLPRPQFATAITVEALPAHAHG